MTPDYARLRHYQFRHHIRFREYVHVHGLLCQDCGGHGGYEETINELGGPWIECGWCEGTGRVTHWLRGFWLRMMREERKRRKSREYKIAQVTKEAYAPILEDIINNTSPLVSYK